MGAPPVSRVDPTGAAGQLGAMIQLYHFALSPFCRKVRLTLAEKKLDVELIEERYWEGSAEFLRRNAAGKVLKHELRAPYWEGRSRRV